MKKRLQKVTNCILSEEPIILPTDTVYGLLCKYNSKKAVERIYKFKKRENNKPLILLGYDWNSLKKFIRISSLSKKINKAFKKEIKENWPGAFTAVLPKSKKVPHFLNKGFKTIGIRVPNNKFLLSVLKECPNRVLASTSANISGKSHLKPQKELLKKVKLFIKAKKGELLLKPSKIIEFKKNKIVILRKG